jgi:hypothetical protein
MHIKISDDPSGSWIGRTRSEKFTNPRISSCYICSKVILGLQLILCQKGLASAKEIDSGPATEDDYHNAAD